MILDNRRLIPDIVVSRDGIPARQNINVNTNINQGSRLLRNPGPGDRGSPSRIPVNKLPPTYVSGNNNGSPRHAPHNGNYFNEAKGITHPINLCHDAKGAAAHPTNNCANKMISIESPIRIRNIPSPRVSRRIIATKTAGSPLHRPTATAENENFFEERRNPKRSELVAGRLIFATTCDSPKRDKTSLKQISMDSPRRTTSNYLMQDSPKHLSQHSTVIDPNPTNNVRNVYNSPNHFHKMSGKDQPTSIPRSPKHQSLAKVFRTRTSSFQDNHIDHNVERYDSLSSKIPVVNTYKTNNKFFNGTPIQENNLNDGGSKTSKLVAFTPGENVRTADLKAAAMELLAQRSTKGSKIAIRRHINTGEDNNSSPARTNSIENHVSNKNFSRIQNSKQIREYYPTKWNSNNSLSTEENSSSLNYSEDSSSDNHQQDFPNLPREKEFNLLSSWASSSNIFSSNSSNFEDDSLKFDGSDLDSIATASSGDSSLAKKMVLIKCKDKNYLTRLYVNNEGIRGLRVVGRVGVGGVGDVMMDPQNPPTAGDLNSNELLNSSSFVCSQELEEFEHEAADYQWLLDYEYRESFTRDSLQCGGREGAASTRVSVLQASQDDASHVNYAALSRNIDADLAEIDMDDFRSEDINQFLVPASSDHNMQNEDDDSDIFCSFSASMMSSPLLQSSISNCESTTARCVQHQQQLKLHQQLLKQQLLLQQQHKSQQDEVVVEDAGNEHSQQQQNFAHEEEQELSTISGDVLSLYQSGPLFSPQREPHHIPPSFSVDSLDSDSIHEDLILTCQANKDNYTIAFEGSFVQYSEDSDMSSHVTTGESEGAESGTWSTERLEGRSPAPNMTHSDEPYTTWSRVSRRSSSNSRTPDHHAISRLQRLSTTVNHQQNGAAPPLLKHVNHHQHKLQKPQQQNQNSKSNSMPNLMRKSLMMKKSLEVTAVAGMGGQCVKVYDLQNSLRANHGINNAAARSVDANNFSLMKLFIKQKSMSREQMSMGSSYTDPSAEGASSSDWPMNSQSDMDGSSSPVPPPCEKIRDPEITDYVVSSETIEVGSISTANNNNSFLDNSATDNIALNFEDSTKDAISKPPLTSPIREEPEGMDMSIGEHKALLDQSQKESHNPILRLKDSKTDQNIASLKVISKEINNKNIQGKTKQKMRTGTKQDSGTATRSSTDKIRSSTDKIRSSTDKIRSSTDNTRSSTDKIINKKSSESEKLLNHQEKPKPKPRYIKQMTDQCLQTSNLKVSTTVNPNNLLDKKDVYVYYPSYALPDLGFLKEKKFSVDTRIFLVPQHYIPGEAGHNTTILREKRTTKRPFSCNDMEKLKNREFNHIKDWESLNFLLPKELKELLLDETDCMETTKPSFCNAPKVTPRRPYSYGCHDYSDTNNKGGYSEASSLNSTQPSSGFRGSSTLLNESEEESTRNSVEEYEEALIHPPTQRPPLPRGILRKCTSLRDDNNKMAGVPKKTDTKKTDPKLREDLLKRRSLQEPIDYNTNEERKKTDLDCSCVSDCTGFCAKGLRRKNLLQVTELPEVSTHEDLTEEDLARLRAQVSQFLTTKRSQVAPNLPADTSLFSCGCSKKSVSFAKNSSSSCAVHDRERKDPHNTPARSRGMESKMGDSSEPSPMLYDAHDKKTLVLSVRAGVEKILKHFRKKATQEDKTKLGNSSQTPEIAQLVLEKLCPAIYALLSDGLLPSLHSLFGKISNSVWRVVEATSQMGASTKALNDLVLTLNSEEGLSEGPIKFNAFIFGLLNIRSLDAWLGYLRTRESALQKHYHPESFLYLSNTAMRSLFDDLLRALRPLSLQPFRLDLMHEYKALHVSLLKMEERLQVLHTSNHNNSSASSEDNTNNILVAKQSKELRNAVARTTTVTSTADRRSRSPRPRSCHETVSNSNNHHQGALKKRWSNVQLGSKLATAMDRLMMTDNVVSSGDDYTDSLDNPKKSSSSREDDDLLLRVSDLSSRDDDFSERSATDKDTDTEKGGHYQNRSSESEGEKFRRLQLKWEAMTLLQKKNNNQEAAAAAAGGGCDQFVVRRDKSVSPGAHPRSRIPRPVSITSPLQNFKPFEADCKTSPHGAKQTNIRKSFPTTSKDHHNPHPHPKPAPRRSLKDRVGSTDQQYIGYAPSSSSLLAKTRVNTRAFSAPGRNKLISRYENSSRKCSAPAPPRSASQGRNRMLVRLVQTLHHRLATDNGHLSFSRGDILTVVVEVDDRFLLCCLHDRKGLVPRASVVPVHQ